MSALEDRLKAVKARPSRAAQSVPPAEAVAATPAPSRRVSGRRPKPRGERWDDRVRRATFYVDVSLLDGLDATCSALDLNKSEVVREALRRHLNELEPR